MKAQVRLISKLLNQEPKKNGTQAWNWLGTTHSGKKLSLYYDEHHLFGHGDFVEVYDSQNVTGLNPAPRCDDVVSFPIRDIPKHFKRAE